MIYLLNGSIGDFLMVLYFMNTLSFVDGGEKFSCIISTPKSVGNYKELAKSYPHISIVKQNIMTMFQNISKGNIVIVPPTPGKNPIHIVLFARILTLFGGRVIGFRDRSRINSFFYETIISFNPGSPVNNGAATGPQAMVILAEEFCDRKYSNNPVERIASPMRVDVTNKIFIGSFYKVFRDLCKYS